MVRQPAVAGMFYPADSLTLHNTIIELMAGVQPSPDVRALIMPHAGYCYSGRVAGQTAAQAVLPECVVLLGPNHTGQGHAYSVMGRGSWRTPLGICSIDEELALRLLSGSRLFADDWRAHQHEHALEVQLPFFQIQGKPFSILPIIIQDTAPDMLRLAGQELAAAIQSAGRSVVVVASSDLSHYVPQQQAAADDALVIAAMVSMEPEQVFAVVARRRISMCGIAPVVVMLHAIRHRGAGGSARLVAYDTSAAVSGDYNRVVGYAGLAISQ